MVPVDPTVLLNTIVYLLDNNGGLKNDRVIRQFLTLMKLAEKLVNKAIYLQILSHTTSEDILRTFLKSDGHRVLIKWLSHFSTEDNHAFLLDTLNILGHLPFNLANVSQNDIDELQLKIAELASAESGKAKDIREIARHLYDIWLTKGVFKTLNPSTPPQLDIDERTLPQPSPTSQSTISVDKHLLTSQKLNQNERTLFSSHNNNKNNSSSFNARKMATTATLTAVSSAGTTSSHSSTDNNKRKSEENLGASTNRKATHRRVSTSLQTDPTKMKTSIDIDDSDGFNKTRTTSTFRIPKLGRSSSGVPSPPQETIDTSTSLNSQTKSATILNRQSSDELNSQQAKRKFSLSQYKEHKRLKSNEVQNSLADTDMRINNMAHSKPSPPMITDDDLPNIPDNQPVVSPKSDETSKDTVIKSNLSEPGVKKVIKKKVIWADERNQTLVQTSFFEVDDSELSDMHVFARTCAANISIAQLEKVMERDLRKRRGVQDMNSNDNDEKQYSTPLPPLIKILLPDAIQIPPIISQERFVQEEREKTVLQALFIRSFLPDSPGEPDGEIIGNNNSEPKLIPLEDDTSSSVSSKVTSVNSNNTTTTTTNIPLVSTNNTIPITTISSTVTPSLSSFSFGDVSPEVAQILAQAKGKLTSVAANNLSTTAPNILINPSTTITTVTSTITNPSVTSTPNLPAPPNFLSAFLNAARTAGNETANVPPPNSIASLLPNLPLNFNLPPPPTPFPLSQLIANALTLGIPPPPTATPSLYQTPPPATFTAPPPPTMSNPIINSVPSGSMNSKPPSVRFVSAIGQQIRPNLTNNHEHHIPSSRENSREHHFRRGPPNNNNNNHNRRDYYQNRNNNNNNNNNSNNSNSHSNNNRNIFS